MANTVGPPANSFVAMARTFYHPVGFSRGYNFVLFFIFAGALMGFTLSRFPYLNFYRVYCANDSLGECYYDQLGLILHLAGILPAAFLACFQFIPVIRHKLLILHRINGYVILLLSIAGTAGGIMAAKHAFGGELSTRLISGVLAIMFVVSMILAYINIKRLQIEQHRAWMLRGWFYVSGMRRHDDTNCKNSVLIGTFPLSPVLGSLHYHDAAYHVHHGQYYQRVRGVL